MDFGKVAVNAMEIIILFDARGSILFSNNEAQAELGYVGQELEFRSIKSIYRQPFQLGGNMAPYSLKRIFSLTESVLYRKNESCFPVRMKIIPCQDYFQLSAINITRLREMEHKAKRVQEEASAAMVIRNEFVANVTHELRTPLNGIRGHLSNILESGLTQEQRQTLDIISRCCVNMSSIINNILDFSKLEAGKFTIVKEEFDFQEMLKHTVDVNINEVNKKGLHLMVNVANDIPKMMVGDKLGLAQILNNLLSNAIKFTQAGYIRLEITKTLEYDNVIELFFMISDTGIGMNREEQDKLFKSFSQVDASITRHFGGTGLGLVITKQLVELMGGMIRVESSKGKGSTFTFSVKLNTCCRDAAEEVKKETLYLFRQPVADIANFVNVEALFRFGSSENAQEIRNKMEKLVICMELEAWEKAEVFADNLKALIKEGTMEQQRAVLRLKMSIRKEDYDASMEQYNKLNDILKVAIGGI